nr:UPF0481 protein At3g47200-like [Ipomoea batatas]
MAVVGGGSGAAMVEGGDAAEVTSSPGAPQDNVTLKFLLQSTGDVSTSDIDLAHASKAIIFGFNVKAPGSLKSYEDKKLSYQCRFVIYLLLNKCQLVQLKCGQCSAGTGCMVIEGKVVKEPGIRVVRKGKEIHVGVLDSSLRRVKETVKEELLRKTNPESYTPFTISIGPYHHGKPELRKMERSKELYTQSFLNRTQGVGVEEYWKKLKELEGRAMSYYGDEIDEEVSGDEFVKMLLLDGCFIVEFVIRVSGLVTRQKPIIDPILMISGMVGNIVRDMLLLENQLPFFVLQALYNMISINHVNKEFSEMVKCAFEDWLPKKIIISLPVYPAQEIKHLLQIVHILCQPQPQPQNNGQIQQQKPCSSSSCCFWKQPQGQGQGGSDIESQSLSNGQHRHRHWACFLSKFWEQPQQSTDVHDVELSSIRTATELQEAGVHFKKLGKICDTSNETISLFDIKFNHGGVLEIPSFALYDSTETFFRNLIAYEQHSPYVRPKYFSDYAVFMDNLINTEKDVNLLRLKDVFLNGLGDDKEVTRLFNNLSIAVTYNSADFYYSDVCRELNRHCEKPWNAAKAKLRRTYFHSPWAVISTFAAILLLSLAIAQTVLSALQLHNRRHVLLLLAAFGNNHKAKAKAALILNPKVLVTDNIGIGIGIGHVFLASFGTTTTKLFPAHFMDDLINTEKDVNLLRLQDVFVNGLGDDKEVTRLFNNLSKGVMHYTDDFYYKDVCTELNHHCQKPRNVLMAKLRHDYFNTPWAGISTFAAILLLTLTIAQTVLSALDLHK